MRRISMVACVALLATPVSRGAGQSGVQDSLLVLQPGIRVRILAPHVTKDRIAGTIQSVRADTVVIDTVDARLENRLFFPSTIVVEQYRSMALPVAAVSHIEESRGHSRMLGMVKGAAKGAVVVGLIAGLGALSGRQHASLRDFTSGFAAGAATGAVIGAPIGYQLGVERWRAVRVKPRRGSTPALIADDGK